MFLSQNNNNKFINLKNERLSNLKAVDLNVNGKCQIQVTRTSM